MKVVDSPEIWILINIYGVTSHKTVICGECLERLSDHQLLKQYPLVQTYTALYVENALISMNFSVLKCRGWINPATIIHLPIF